MTKRGISIWVWSVIFLIGGRFCMSANEHLSSELFVPMHYENTFLQRHSIHTPSSSSIYSCQPSSRNNVSSHVLCPSVHNRSFRNRTNIASATSSLSLGYVAASSCITSGKKTAFYAPPSSGAGGSAVGNALANWMEANAGGAWLYTDNGVKYYDMNILEQLFNSTGGINDMPDLTWQEFLQWFNNNNQTQYKAPLAEDLAPYFLLILCYSIHRYFKTHKQKQTLNV